MYGLREVNIIGDFPKKEDLKQYFPDSHVERLVNDVRGACTQLSCLGVSGNPALLVSNTVERSDIEVLIRSEPGASIFVFCDEHLVTKVSAAMLGLARVQALSKHMPLVEIARIVNQSYAPVPA